jgi:hypothetical protein
LDGRSIANQLTISSHEPDVGIVNRCKGIQAASLQRGKGIVKAKKARRGTGDKPTFKEWAPGRLIHAYPVHSAWNQAAEGFVRLFTG